MRISLVGSLGLLGLAVPAIAGPADVNAQAFYADAEQLMGKGVRAMFDKRTKPRMAQLKAAAELAKAENDRATAKGQPIYCVSDAERKKGLSANAVVEMLGALPESDRRRMTLAQAWRAALIREYPCR